MKRLLLAAALSYCTLSASGMLRAYGEESGLRWYKGNTHTHTVNSDGDSSPDVVARWYKEHGYNFLVVTDHNFVTDVQGLNAVFAAEDRFLVLSGEEVTDSYEGPEGGYAAIHLNAIEPDHVIPPAGGASVVETTQADVDAMNAAGALVHLNHPNFHWSYSAGQMAAVKNYHLFEVANFHPAVNNAGGGGYPCTEALWDSLLTRGIRMYGVASDDAHHFKESGPEYANPGRGWVMVRCAALTAEEIVSALDRGDFYSSSGVVLEEIRFDGKSLTVRMKEERNLKYTVSFIGKGGKTLAVAYDNPAVYVVKGDEGYVRARVVDSNGRTAWVQPVWTK
ncbi:MAG: CehA/McbA family metallohydrolase [Candidatus Glassbacteria bacterium]|nr:CehA/McbA family metallohydrolase [Candidatus Glassbacteria bacterium]